MPAASIAARRIQQRGAGQGGVSGVDDGDTNGGRARDEASGRVNRTWQLATQGPFHLEATVRVLQRRPANPVDVWDRDRYRRLLPLAEGVALVEVQNRGSIDAPDVRFTIRRGPSSAVACREAGRMLCRILGLDVDPTLLQRAAARRHGMTAPARALRGLRPPRFAGLFETFANVVPFQQLSLDAGVAIVSRLVAKFGPHIDHDGHRFRTFPTAPRIAGAHLGELRACGLSARKAQVLRDLACIVASGALAEDRLQAMSTAVARRVLTGLPGIGPWSADLVLLRGLGRIDVFPQGDAGAERGLRLLRGLAPRAPLGDVIDGFGRYRGFLYFLLLGSSLLRKGYIHAAPEAPRAAGIRQTSPV